MACFTAPVAEAVIVKAVEKYEQKKELNSGSCEHTVNKVSIPLSRRLKWLSNMLFGGSALLAFEHIWHGEIVPWFPFLTAMSNAEDAAEMFREISTVGVSMAVLITGVWFGICAVAGSIVRRNDNADTGTVTD
ncbi:MAG: hypothetical protein K6E53_06145 [Lachnospiraceae bacterium]|nr:hypothetical protein [Lachnospiraceae bacterium]